MPSTVGIVASGVDVAKPVVTLVGEDSNVVTNIGGIDYRVVTWLSSGSITVSGGTLDVEYLVVGGGGGGGGWFYAAGGGGGGGVLSGSTTAAIGTNNVVVGAGGLGGSGNVQGDDGSSSSVLALTAVGGGGGGSGTAIFPTHNGRDGGSGGGAGSGSSAGTGGTGTSGQGNNGGDGFSSAGEGPRAGGGGGGASSAGANAASGTGGVGGSGSSSSITGTPVTYGGGGGGASSTTAGTGGTGGGGAGGNVSAGIDGVDGLGGGGGGGGGNNPGGGDGGDGIVILRYKVSDEFSPLDLPSLLGWWDASDSSTITASGTPQRVSQWDDKTGTYNATQATAGLQPEYSPTESLGGIRVGPSNQRLATGLAANRAPVTIFLAVRRVGSATNAFNNASFLLNIDASSGFTTWTFQWSDQDGTSFRAQARDSGGANIAFLSPYDTTRHAFTIVGTSTSVSLRQDKGSAASTAHTRNTAQLTNNWSFGTGAPSFQADAWLHEIIICDAELSQTEQDATVDYLLSKWNI